MPVGQIFLPANLVFTGIGILLAVSDLIFSFCGLLTPAIFRRPAEVVQAKKALPTSSNPSELSSVGLKLIPTFRKHQPLWTSR